MGAFLGAFLASTIIIFNIFNILRHFCESSSGTIFLRFFADRQACL